MILVSSKSWRSASGIGLTGMVICCLLMASACGIESKTSDEDLNPTVEATLGEVDDLFDYVNPESGDAAIPGLTLETWVSAMEAQGVSWLEEGTPNGDYFARWLGTAPSGFTASASVNADVELVEVNCSVGGSTEGAEVAEALRTCYELIVADGFDASVVTEWATATASELAEEQYGVAQAEVFGPIWIMLTSGATEHSTSVVLRRADL